MHTELTALGKALKLIRKNRGLSQKELSNIVHIRQATISDIENGKSNFNIQTLMSLCDALNVNINIEFSKK